MKPSEHEALRALLGAYKEAHTPLLDFLEKGESWMRRCRSLFRLLRVRAPHFLKTTRLMAEVLSELREFNADLMIKRYAQLGQADQVLVHMARISFMLRDLEQEVFLLAKASAQDADQDDFLIKRVSIQLDLLESYRHQIERLTIIEKALTHLLHDPLEIEEVEEDTDR